MSAQLPISGAASAAPSRRTTSNWWRNPPQWLREPLLHFVILGGLLFALDHFIFGSAGDPRSIVVSADVDAEAKRLFQGSRGKDPNADELQALRAVWLDNEVLYREGLAMQLDRGDTAIRERVIFKALEVINANTKLPAYDDKTLREWFEGHRAKYDEPKRYTFQEAVLAGDNSETAVRAFVAALNAGTPPDAQAGLRVFKGRPLSNLVLSYGPDFAPALDAALAGKWQVQQTREGWRAIQLESITPPKAAAYEPLRGVVLQDWTDAVMSEQRSAAVRTLAKKYTIKYQAAQ